MCTIEEIHQAVDIICKYEDAKNLVITENAIKKIEEVYA